MNSKTAKLLSRVARVFNKRLSSLKKRYHLLSNTERAKAKEGFNIMLRKAEMEQRVIDGKKKIEEKKIIDKLENKMEGKDE